MAVLQIHVIRATGGRNQLNDRIKYIMNPEKTACKGFHSFFGIKDTLTSGFTCACDEAYQQMMETKQHEKKTDKVLGYHYIQSFKFANPLSPVKLRRKKRTKLGANLSSDASQKILKL